MGVFEWGNFPYSDFHSLNLDWILNTLKQFGVIIDDIPDMIDKAVKDAISDERLTELILNIMKDYMINVKFPPNGITPAKGDGTTDDAAAIQGCIDYAESIGGGCVFFPSGKYLASGLTLKNNVGLNGMQGASLILKGGSNVPLITSTANNVFLSGLTLDCNSEVQVNDINTLVFSGDNCRLKDLIIKGGERSLSYVGGGVLQGDCLYFDSAINTALVISGSVIVQLSELYFKSISEVSGESAMFISSDDGSYTDVVINAKVPVGIKCNGNNNRFNALIKNATTDYVDTHKTNSWDIAFSTKIERYENKQVNITGDLTVNANHETTEVAESTENVSGTKTVNAEDIVLNSVNPLTYKKPEGDKKYKYVKFKDLEGNIYNILVAGNNFNYAGDLTLNGNGNFNIATLYDMEYYQSLGELSTKNSEYFRISTYNILPVNYWRYPENKYDKYLDGCISVIETILKSKSNIVGCQEVCGSGLHDFSKYIDFYNKYKYFKYSGKWINGLGNSTLGNSISLDRAASYEATEIDGNRIILKSNTTVFNKNCSIYVVHFDTDDETRVKNIDSLYNLLLSDLNDIIFIIGDFNCNYNYEPERNELQKITDIGFNISNTTEPTFYNGAIIDYIFYKGVNMVNSEIIKNPFITDDHYLLLADFEEE